MGRRLNQGRMSESCMTAKAYKSFSDSQNKSNIPNIVSFVGRLFLVLET